MKRPILLLALLCHLALSAGYALLTPAFEGPDEGDHYAYAFHLANAGERPVPRGHAAALGRPLLDEAGLAHHPFLYYQLLAATMRISGRDDYTLSLRSNPARMHGHPLNYLHGGDEVAPVSIGISLLRWLRSWSIVLGLVSVVLVYRLGRLAFPDRRAVADIAALVTACLPMFSFMHGVLNNDNLATLLSQAALVAFGSAVYRDRLTVRDGILVGAILGAAMLTKLTTFFLLVIWAVFVVWSWKRRANGIKVFAAVSAMLALAIAGPMFVQNYRISGDPLMWSAHAGAFGEATKVPEGRTLEWLTDGFFPQIFSSLLGNFGWFSHPPARWLVFLGGIAALLSLFGWVRAVQRGTWPRLFALLCGSTFLVFALTLKFNLDFRQPQGRLLFPAIGPMAVLFAAGLCQLVRKSPWWRLAVAVPPAIAFWVLVMDFAPAFDPATAQAPPHHASLVGGITEPVEDPGIELAAPAGSPPTLSFREPGAPSDAVYTLYVYDREGRVWGAMYEWTQQFLTPPTFRMPAAWWELLPGGREYLLKVRRVPNWRQGERGVVESGVVVVVK